MFLIGLNACAQSSGRGLTTATPAQGAPARSVQASSNDGSFLVTVYPYAAPEGEKNTSTMSDRTKIIPLTISLNNTSDGMIVVRRGEISLELSDGSRLFATNPQYVTEGYPLGAPASVLDPLRAAIVRLERHEDLQGVESSQFTKELTTLNNGQSAQGIVFFVVLQGGVLPGNAGIERATLHVPFHRDSSGTILGDVVTVQLTDLEFLVLVPPGWVSGIISIWQSIPPPPLPPMW